MIDWIALLETYHVDYATTGKSTSKGNVYVRCPWCGTADQGHHMGISLSGRGYGCWRSERHRGRNPARLVAALLGKSYGEAQRILGRVGGAVRVTDNDLLTRVQRLLSDSNTEPEKPPIKFPDSFVPLRRQIAGRRFADYLHNRGYAHSEIPELARSFALRYCLDGLFRYRLVFPVFGEDGLMTWTGRGIADSMEPRYLSLSVDEEKAERAGLPVARAPINNCLLNEDMLFDSSGDALVVCEGPFDAMRMDWLGRPRLRATCIFGKVLHDEQIGKLRDIAPSFRNRWLLLDDDAALDAFRVSTHVEAYGFKRHLLSSGQGDPAEMREKDLRFLISHFIAGR